LIAQKKFISRWLRKGLALNMAKTRTKSSSLGKFVEQRIVSRLGKFVDVLAANKPIAKEFTCRTVCRHPLQKTRLKPKRREAP